MQQIMTNVMVKPFLNWNFYKKFEFDSGNEEYQIYPKAEFIRIPNVPKCGLNTRHDNREDNREVTLIHLIIHLTRAQIFRSDKCAIGSIHTNGSMTINLIPC